MEEESAQEIVRPDEDLDLKAKEKRLGKFLSRWCVESFFLFPSRSGRVDFSVATWMAWLSNH